MFQGDDEGPIQGDYNNDGSVDSADYTVWRDNVGGFELTNETVSLGSVDDEDYLEWKTHFAPGPARIKTTIDNLRFLGGAGSASSTGVPEPSTLVLLILTSAACFLNRPRGRSDSAAGSAEVYPGNRNVLRPWSGKIVRAYTADAPAGAAAWRSVNRQNPLPFIDTCGISIIAATNKPSPSAVSKIPCSCGQIAADSVIAKITAAGATTPADALATPPSASPRGCR